MGYVTSRFMRVLRLGKGWPVLNLVLKAVPFVERDPNGLSIISLASVKLWNKVVCWVFFTSNSKTTFIAELKSTHIHCCTYKSSHKIRMSKNNKVQ